VALLSCVWAGFAVLVVQAHAGRVATLSRALPPSTWVALSPLPNQGPSAILALGVNPYNNQVVIAARSDGAILRSADGGSTWNVVQGAGARVWTIAFSPSKTSGLVLAGLSRAGALASRDGGVTWGPVTGLSGRTVRVFAFAFTFVVAGTDHGVYASADGLAWRQSGLPNTSIGALTVTAIHDPVRLVAGCNVACASGPLLFQSIDGGTTWVQIKAAISGNVVSSLAAGPLRPASTTRPLVVGTNTGLFTSPDNGATFAPVSGGGLLPSTDYTQIAFVTTHFDRFYAASDGGESASGGLWRTRDAARHFVSLAPPMPSVTALAVSNDEIPILYVATSRPADQVAVLWAYHDTGASPQGLPTTPTPPTSGTRTNSPPPAGTSGISQLLLSARTPYIAIGLVAVIVILMAVVSHFRGRRG
jgi:hypothetical protein